MDEKRKFLARTTLACTQTNEIAGAPRHKICTASLDNRPLIDGFVFLLDFGLVRPKSQYVRD